MKSKLFNIEKNFDSFILFSLLFEKSCVIYYICTNATLNSDVSFKTIEYHYVLIESGVEKAAIYNWHIKFKFESKSNHHSAHFFISKLRK